MMGLGATFTVSHRFDSLVPSDCKDCLARALCDDHPVFKGFACRNQAMHRFSETAPKELEHGATHRLFEAHPD